jgi:exopolysaccharide biosynthesis polyprenyl glycosylphosphotransferase
MSATGQRLILDDDAANVQVLETWTIDQELSARSAAQGEGSVVRGLPFLEAFVDFLVVTAAVLGAIYLGIARHTVAALHASPQEAITVAAFVALLVVFLLSADHAYQVTASMLRIRETERAIRIPVQTLLALLPLSMWLHSQLAGIVFLRALILIPAFLILEKQMAPLVSQVLRKRKEAGKCVAIYAPASSCRHLISALFNSPRLGLHPTVVIDEDAGSSSIQIHELGYHRRRSVPVHAGPATPALLRSCGCDILLFAVPNAAPEQRDELLRRARHAGMRTACAFDAGAHASSHSEIIQLDGLWLAPLSDPTASWYYAAAKRVIDVVGSSLLLTLLAPFLFLIALLIRLDSPGPAFFVQKRVGLNGRLFDMYKFRTMHIGAARYEISPATPDDRRITRIGRFLRHTSLDELPQLLNVLLGNMSLVGPRPEMPFIVDNYNDYHRQRLQVIPGITGLWQLSADRTLRIHENMEYDLYYIRYRSFFMDIAILVHTLFFAMRGV